MESIKPGRYRHFKGKEYEVLGVARHSETEEELVVYRALYGDFGLWVRPVSMWNDSGDNGMAVMTKHMRIYRIYLGNFYVEGLRCLPDVEGDSADRDPALPDHVRNFMHRSVKGLSKCTCKILNQSFSAAGFRIFYGVLRGILWDFRQEGPAGAMVSHQHPLDLQIFQIIRKLSDIVKKARRLNENGFSILLHRKYLVADQVVCFIGMQLDASEIVNIHFPFCKLHCCKCVFIHNLSLQILFPRASERPFSAALVSIIQA